MTGTDTIARIGSDDFAILRTVNSQESDMTQLGEDLRKVISRPFIIGDEKLHINASFGIAVVTEPSFPDDPKANAYELIRTAQIALYRSKSRQRSSDSVVVFDDSMRSAVDDHHRLMADLPMQSRKVSSSCISNRSFVCQHLSLRVSRHSFGGFIHSWVSFHRLTSSQSPRKMAASSTLGGLYFNEPPKP